MISLFLFKTNSRGMQYGMGTYTRELTEALLIHTNVNLYIVNCYNNEEKEFTIKTISSRYFKISIPSPKISSPHNNLFIKKYASIVVKLLSDVIPKNEEIVFQLNHVDDLPIIIKLKEEYRHPVISVVHIAQLQQLFNGTKQNLIGLNIDVPSNEIEFTLFKEKEVYRLSDHIISVTTHMKKLLVEEYGIIPDKIDIISNGINYGRYQIISQEEKLKIRFNLGFGAHEKIILYSGRIDTSKGIYYLLESFIEACKYQKNLRLVLIGQGNIQDCMQKYNSFYGKITFTGFLTSEQVKAFYKIANVGVIPSFYEQCPYSVLEMMAYEIPLILSRIDGLKEMLNDSQCLFIDPIISDHGEMSFNKKEVADAILSLVNDKERAKHLTRDYPELIRTKYSGQRMAGEMHRVMKSLSIAAVET